jgi:hypothetical protein
VLGGDQFDGKCLHSACPDAEKKKDLQAKAV